MDISSFLFGSEDKFNKIDTMSPEQKNFFTKIFEMLSPQGNVGQGQQAATAHLMQLLNPSSEAYKKFEQPYMNQFEQQTIPGLAERFSGMGGGLGGGMSSSGFGQALSSAGGNLQSQLASMKTGMQSQAANNLMQQFQQMMGQGMGAQPFAYGHQQASSGLLADLLSKFAQGAGQSFGGGF